MDEVKGVMITAPKEVGGTFYCDGFQFESNSIDSTFVIYASGFGFATGTASEDGQTIHVENDEFSFDAILDEGAVAFDIVYAYVYREALGGYEVGHGPCPGSYFSIKNNINGRPTVRLGDSLYSHISDLVIPATITSIGRETCYGCGNLTYIRFEGTIAQWNAIEITDSYWCYGVPATEVICSDGTVPLIKP